VRVHPANRLTFEELTDELHQRQHEFRNRSFDVSRIDVPLRRAGRRQRAFELGAKRVDFARGKLPEMKRLA
jgi:hypothetical protein